MSRFSLMGIITMHVMHLFIFNSSKKITSAFYLHNRIIYGQKELQNLMNIHKRIAYILKIAKEQTDIWNYEVTSNECSG